MNGNESVRIEKDGNDLCIHMGEIGEDRQLKKIVDRILEEENNVVLFLGGSFK